ncbi:hypothetical protein [Bacillus cereus group sp. BY8-1LC]|uniref:hypothetical protein n=1 Tax=Bacillus cereus group sp. BY8-1LC TaxID=3018076 RepID=UPI0022E19CD9|nr:hypothetical protein [Bacillus cereus group sp. BY8-1LC]MDA1795663.1 hypothetical protein [Bacillus cereus group sp. BY8-1LC]
MPLMYSSPVTKETGFIDLKKFLTEKNENFILVLDSNVCIYLEDYFKNPIDTINRWKKSNPELLTDFFEMIKTVREYNLEFQIHQALNENCRNISQDYSLNVEKFVTKQDYILSILEDFPLKEVLYPNKPFESEHNINHLKQIMEPIVKNLDNPKVTLNLLLSYICTLKLRLLIENRDLKKHEKLRNYYDFMSKTVNIISLAHFGTAILTFSDFKLKNGKGMASLIHTKKKKNYSKRESFIQAIWNAAIDFAWVIEVCQEADYEKTPIFVTNDFALNEIMQRYNMILRIKDIQSAPVFARYDYSGIKFDSQFTKELNMIEEELTLRHANIDNIIYNFNQQKNNNKIMQRLLSIKEELEALIPY